MFISLRGSLWGEGNAASPSAGDGTKYRSVFAQHDIAIVQRQWVISILAYHQLAATFPTALQLMKTRTNRKECRHVDLCPNGRPTNNSCAVCGFPTFSNPTRSELKRFALNSIIRRMSFEIVPNAIVPAPLPLFVINRDVSQIATQSKLDAQMRRKDMLLAAQRHH